MCIPNQTKLLFQDYEGGRTASDIVRWAEEKAADAIEPPEVKQVNTIWHIQLWTKYSAEGACPPPLEIDKVR